MQPGDVIAYMEMCNREGASLQRGMNFQLGANHSVLLMSRRPNAPYIDRIQDSGEVLVYEGHDEPKSADTKSPKTVDQPEFTPKGTLTQNGQFKQAATAFKRGIRPAERVRVYEKLFTGVWVFNGEFDLIDCWNEDSDGRQVFKFKLRLRGDSEDEGQTTVARRELEHDRVIPSAVKLEVWKRDKGKCVQCGATDNLHFDHIIPYSRGGSSLVAKNVQLLCAKHNLAKRDRIE
ncbi:MAG: HNH endonuclease [Planctomycetes bacterium]|nr:HNH endonuclease [Planctomycetota bacterium]